ncbi:MAG: GNAT family N-acetyltransferase [Candidatus Thorarchaeota archaeon]
METVRPLRDSDWDDILEIARHTWDGHDYLPFFFENWLNDKDSHTVAIERDNHVIALANLRVIEDGRTGWMEGLRVHPDHRNQGLAMILTNHVVAVAKELSVERVRFTTAVSNEASLHMGEQVGMKRKFDLAFHWQDRIDEVSWSSKVRPIREVSAEDLHPLLIDAELLPFDVIVYDWKAFDVSRRALDKIGLLTKFWIQIEEGELMSFSLGFIRQDQTGPQWSFTIYASDEVAFQDQLSHHLRMTVDRGCKSIFMTYQMDYIETLYSLHWIQPIEEDMMALTLLEKVF